ncbi:unnamed protein product [Parascedosporium putredinis]|uniref:Calcineurin-like phosphoesterase domain-containing protein n=1 Tax=Parascedosporium putredinis TaxID=1442378 RepID=A0A9P1HB73_9PEZI|nr:unnamed protein product [Parascedosporium putredinis]CAI8002926.1 unnamed protein product [Parascedosporium putredinis]
MLLSDIHLEIASQYTTYTFPATAPILLLAGDVGNLVHYPDYLAFLASLAPRYDRVLLLLGNHDFYGLTYDAALDAARRLVAEPCLAGKVLLLHRTRWDDPDSDLTVLGCTLWSRVPAKARDTVFYRVSDYLHIKEWSVEKHNEKHIEEVAWLRAELRAMAQEHKAAVKRVTEENKRRRKQSPVPASSAAATPTTTTTLPTGEPTSAPSDPSPSSPQPLPLLPLPRRRILVATHHAPCVHGAQRPDKADKPWASAFVTDLMLVKGTRIVANQRGYDFKGNPDPKDENFDPAYVIKM